MFSNPWSQQPTTRSTQSLPCLDDDCERRFLDHNTRTDHYLSSHRYSSLWAYGKKPLRCQLCRRAFQKDDTLKHHIRFKHKPTPQELGITHKDQESLILQSHVPTTDRKRSEPPKDRGDTRVGRQDESSEEQSIPVPSRRNSLLQSRAVQYLKRKGSQIIAPLTKKVRNASIQDTGDPPTNVG